MKIMPTTLKNDAEAYAKFFVDNVPQAKAWVDPVGQAAWYISHGFACAVRDGEDEIVSLVTSRPVERPGLGVIPYYFNEGGTTLHVDMLLDISPDQRSLMVIKLFLQWRFPQCTVVEYFRHFEEKLHVYKLPEFWAYYDRIKRIKDRRKVRQRDAINYKKKAGVK